MPAFSNVNSTTEFWVHCLLHTLEAVIEALKNAFDSALIKVNKEFSIHVMNLLFKKNHFCNHARITLALAQFSFVPRVCLLLGFVIEKQHKSRDIGASALRPVTAA